MAFPSQADLTIDDVASADEVLLTSTTVCILPVTQFNGQPIGSGRPGKVFSAIDGGVDARWWGWMLSIRLRYADRLTEVTIVWQEWN